MGWITRTRTASKRRRGRQACPLVLKDEKTKMIVAKVAPSKSMDARTVDSARKALEQLGHRRIILKSDSEPAILALKEAVKR